MTYQTEMDSPAGLAAGLGWTAEREREDAEALAGGRRPARVVAVHKETSIVRGADGVDRPAIVSGRFRYDALAPSEYPAVGDWVALEPRHPEAGPDDPAVIASILPRRSAFRRQAADSTRRGGLNLHDEQVIAANIDVAFIVAGLDGDFNLRRLERYLAVAWSSGVDPVIVLNKADIAEDLPGRLVAVEAIAPGVTVVIVSALTGDHVADLAPYLGAGRTAVVLGSSGVGKSTLVNALLGEERQATASVREDDSRGRHTTTHRELFVLPTGALLIDTPGIRSLEVAGADEGIETAFDDVATLAEQCRFNDCRHDGEPGCAVQAAITAGDLPEARLASFRKLERETAHEARRSGDRAAQIAERKRWKVIHKAVNKHMKHKYGEAL
jgi:ribosome biogenesis GTPase